MSESNMEEQEEPTSENQESEEETVLTEEGEESALEQDETEEMDEKMTEKLDRKQPKPVDGGKKKEVIPGIIYLGHIPPRLRPRNIRNMLSIHGEVGRIFLQAEDRFIRKKKKKSGSNARDFTEGWVEFRDKRVAKLVAASLNSQPMGVRKKHRFHDDLWSMKYLHRFKWSHLSEKLAIERQVRKQRMRVEVSQAKRETNFYLQSVERGKKLAKAESKKAEEPESSAAPAREWNFKQRKTEEEIQVLKSDKKRIQKRQELTERAQEKSQTNRSLLQKIFNAS